MQIAHLKTYNKNLMQIALAICIVGILSCGRRSSNSNGVNQEEGIKNEIYRVLLEKTMGKEFDINLSEIGNVITYIPLETNSKSLLSDIKQVSISDSMIYVCDWKSAMQFDMSGRFTRQFGRQGRGPGEYNRIMGCSVSSDGKQFYVLTTFHQWLLYDNHNGEFIKSFRLDSLEPTQILPLNHEKVLFYCFNAPKYVSPGEYSLFITDMNGHVVKTYKNHHKRVNNPGLSIGTGPFYIYQGKVRFKEYGVDTLYTVTEEALIPHAIIDLGKYALPADLLILDLDIDKTLANHPGKVAFRNMVEDTHAFYMTFDYLLGKDSTKYVYFDKYTNDSKLINRAGFRNNIDGGLPFFPKYVYHDSILVGYINPMDLREHIHNSDATEMKRLYGKKHEDLVALANSINDESNPILVVLSKH